MARPSASGRVPEQLSTRDLLTADRALARELQTSPAALLTEGHSRIAAPLLGLAGPLVGFSALLIGGFSRFGLWRQMLGAVVLLVLIQLTDNFAVSMALRTPHGWPLTYAAPALGMVLAAVLLWWAALPRRRRRDSDPALTAGLAA